jgi:amino acid adenylation domain-containing protein
MIAVAAGAVCVPLNPGFTADEWQRYFGDLDVAALLTREDINSACRGVAHALGLPIIDLSPQPRAGPGAFRLVGSATQHPAGGEFAHSTDDAFILLTSGSSSQPKMVPLTHASVCLSALNVGTALALGPRDRLLSVLPLFHGHGLISGVLASLAAGSSVICTPGFDAAAFFGWLKEFRPTWYTAVPAIHRALLLAVGSHRRKTQHTSLRLIRSASSPLPSDVLSGLETLFGVPMIDSYGMTEAATQIAANPLGRRKVGSVGQPAGAEIAIMDDKGRQLRDGERGEVVLRGPTITRGYLNDAAATRSAFRDGWFRTGDIGYLDQEGYLFIVGRIKDVINRGGQEIAPAEIEEALLSHPDVVEAVAFSIPHRRLGADIAAAAVLFPKAKVGASKLRAFLRERLASYKIPAFIRIVPQIPKGPGGKVKRNGLLVALSITPRMIRSDRAGKMVPHRSALKQHLSKAWAELLEVDRVGVDEDVFALGADSLTVTQMLSRLRTRFSVDFSITDIFDAPTVEALAGRIEASGRNPISVSVSLRDTQTDVVRVRLSFQQQRIYVLSRVDPTGHIYHVVEVARFLGLLDLAALTASIATICKRHEVLRSTFSERLGEPMQTVGEVIPRLEHVDLGRCPKSERDEAIQRQAQQSLHQPLDLENEPPLLIQVLRLDENDHALIIKLHHLVTDGWSQRLFWEELEALYTASLNGTSRDLPDLPIQYRHFAEQQRAWLGTRAAEEQLRYWRGRLEGLTALPLRADLPRPEIWTGRGARYPLQFSRALSDRIRRLSREHRVTLFMTLLAAFQCLLHRYTEHNDVAVGSLIANRNQIQIERLMGMFANTVVLRTDLSGDPSFGELLRRVRHVTLDAYRYQDLPLEKILQSLQVSRDADWNTLFRVMFILRNASPRAPVLPGLSVDFVGVDPGTARSDLILELADVDGCLGGWLEYSTDLFEAATIARMATHLRTLLEGIVANPEERISRLPLLSAGDRRRVLVDCNDTKTSFAHLGTFSERFTRQVLRTPKAIAVSAGQVRQSYRELARRSSAIADQLALEGVGPDVIVILVADRCFNFLAAMIAVQQVGGAFLPLDPALPAARLVRIVNHGRAPLVLAGEECTSAVNEALSGIPPRRRPKILNLEELTRTLPRDPVRPIRARSSSLAYVIYTSGSTGVPKGAMVERRGLFNLLHSLIDDLELTASDVIAHTAPQSFVISVWQFLTPLLVGARVHICVDNALGDPTLLVQEVVREGVTVLQIVPAMLRAILQQVPNDPCFRALSRLRWLISTGEALAPDLCRDWFRYFPDVPVINAYGSTECSDDVARHRIVKAPASLATLPIGRPIANTQLYVLDTHLQPMPVGVVGELYVGGIGVGRGYLNDAKQTRQRFLRDPFSKRRSARLYRTGDLARWRPDRTLEFLGRIDDQVKIRGHRIELKEVEHALAEHADVQAAVVLARGDLGGEARLVAYIVAVEGRQPGANALRHFLKTKLPSYMIPAGYVFLERIPLTAHGKVDRAALMAISQGLKVAGREFVAPRHSTEEVLVDIWAKLLGINAIGVFDNFFDLGGHSLLAGQVLARITNALGVSLPIRALFEAPTVEALARRVDEARETLLSEATPVIAEADGDGPRSVSIVQETVLRTERELPGLPQFNLPSAYRLQGPLNVSALERSLAEIVRRHASLRTGFAWVGEQPIALIAPAADVESPLLLEDLSAGIPTGRRTKALLRRKAELKIEQEAWTPFDITRAPLFRARLFRLGADDHVLVLILHHIIVDGWSIDVFMEELSEFYTAFVAGRQARLPRPALQVSDFAGWQRRWSASDAATRQFAYWKEHLRGLQPVFPPADNVGTSLLTARFGHEPINVSTDLVARLSTLGRSQGATLFMTLLAGFKSLLLFRTGRSDICVATTMANRSQIRLERVIGPLENAVLIRTRISEDLSFQQVLSRVRDSALEAYARQEFPFEMLVDRLAEESDLDPASFVQVVFVLRNALRQELKLPDVAARSFGNVYTEGQPVLPIDCTCLAVTLKETHLGITGSCRYKSDLFESDTLQDWVADYRMVLAKAAANPESPLGRLADC